MWQWYFSIILENLQYFDKNKKTFILNVTLKGGEMIMNESDKLRECQKEFIINRIWSRYDDNAIDYVCKRSNLLICLNIKDLSIKDLYRLDKKAINSIIPHCNKCNYCSKEFNRNGN